MKFRSNPLGYSAETLYASLLKLLGYYSRNDEILDKNAVDSIFDKLIVFEIFTIISNNFLNEADQNN